MAVSPLHAETQPTVRARACAIILLVSTLTLLTLFRSGQLLNLSEWQSTAAATKSLRQAGNSKAAHLAQEMESLRQENARLRAENERLTSTESGKASAKQPGQHRGKRGTRRTMRKPSRSP